MLGLGQVVVRDVVDFLKYHDRDDSGAPNPLGSGSTEKAYAWVALSPGRAIRDFIYHGLNDKNGRRIFDGVIINASGAGRLATSRYANLNSPGSQQYEDHANPSDIYPFAYVPCTEPSTGQTDAILKRPTSDPFVIHIQTSSEYWQRRGSLVHTSSSGDDLPEAKTCVSSIGRLRSIRQILQRCSRGAVASRTYKILCRHPSSSAPCSMRWMRGRLTAASHPPVFCLGAAMAHFYRLRFGALRSLEFRVLRCHSTLTRTRHFRCSCRLPIRTETRSPV